MRNAGAGLSIHPPYRIDIDIVSCAAAEFWGRKVALFALGRWVIYSTRITTLRLFNHTNQKRNSVHP